MVISAFDLPVIFSFLKFKNMNASIQNAPKKRLSLDVFKEKEIGGNVDQNLKGGTTLPCISVSVVLSIILSDCHSAE